MTTLTDIQIIINNKAKERAKEEVTKLITAIKQNSSLHNMLDHVYIKVEENKNDSIRTAFWSITNPIPAKLVEKLTEIYIPEESKAFIEKVDKLSEEIEELKNFNYE